MYEGTGISQVFRSDGTNQSLVINIGSKSRLLSSSSLLDIKISASKGKNEISSNTNYRENNKLGRAQVGAPLNFEKRKRFFINFTVPKTSQKDTHTIRKSLCPKTWNKKTPVSHKVPKTPRSQYLRFLVKIEVWFDKEQIRKKSCSMSVEKNQIRKKSNTFDITQPPPPL